MRCKITLMLYTLSILITLSFWPISLYLANTFPNFIEYSVPALLVIISIFLKVKKTKLFPVPLFFIPIIEPKLALFPLIYLVLDMLISGGLRHKLIFITIAFILFIAFLKPFMGQTIFVPDYEARQKVIRDTQLYPSILLARTFHNKFRIITDKFIFNFFSLTDPNNYFFGFHPRQIIGNQSLSKFPFLSVFFFLAAIYKANQNKYKKIVFPMLLGALLVLSSLTNFDRNDFILWPSLSLLVIEGAKIIKKNAYGNILFTVYFIFTLVELIRIAIIYI